MPFSIVMARLTSEFEPFIRPYFLIAFADSSVSFTQRPEVAASSEPPAAPAPALRTVLEPWQAEVPRLQSFGHEEASTAAGSPMTASPSPSLISWISLFIVWLLKWPPGHRGGCVLGCHSSLSLKLDARCRSASREKSPNDGDPAKNMTKGVSLVAETGSNRLVSSP